MLSSYAMTKNIGIVYQSLELMCINSPDYKPHLKTLITLAPQLCLCASVPPHLGLGLLWAAVSVHLGLKASNPPQLALAIPLQLGLHASILLNKHLVEIQEVFWQDSTCINVGMDFHGMVFMPKFIWLYLIIATQVNMVHYSPHTYPKNRAIRNPQVSHINVSVLTDLVVWQACVVMTARIWISQKSLLRSIVISDWIKPMSQMYFTTVSYLYVFD